MRFSLLGAVLHLATATSYLDQPMYKKRLANLEHFKLQFAKSKLSVEKLVTADQVFRYKLDRLRPPAMSTEYADILADYDAYFNKLVAALPGKVVMEPSYVEYLHDPVVNFELSRCLLSHEAKLFSAVRSGDKMKFAASLQAMDQDCRALIELGPDLDAYMQVVSDFNSHVLGMVALRDQITPCLSL